MQGMMLDPTMGMSVVAHLNWAPLVTRQAAGVDDLWDIISSIVTAATQGALVDRGARLLGSKLSRIPLVDVELARVEFVSRLTLGHHEWERHGGVLDVRTKQYLLTSSSYEDDEMLPPGDSREGSAGA